VLQEFLEPIRKRRAEFAKDARYVWDVAFTGTDVANEVANQTLMEVKAAMGIDYLNQR